MRIGIYGSKISGAMIVQIISEKMPDIKAAEWYYGPYQEGLDAIHKWQSASLVDAIMFTGPGAYEFVSKRIALKLPCNYLSHDELSLTRAVLKAIALFPCDLSHVSLDRCNPELLQTILRQAGFPKAHITLGPGEIEPADYETTLMNFHRRCYQEKIADICFTTWDRTAQMLQEEGIPCVRVQQTEENVLMQLYKLYSLYLAKTGDNGKNAVIAFQYEPRYFSDEDEFTQPCYLTSALTKYTTQAFTLAQQMGAAVFTEGSSKCYLTTTRGSLLNLFLTEDAYQTIFPGFDEPVALFIGIGIGNTLMHAKYRADRALYQSSTAHTSGAYLIESDGKESFFPAPVETPYTNRWDYIARKCGISVKKLQKLSEIQIKYPDGLTTEILAEELGQSKRNANRVIATLERNGYIMSIGKKSLPKGRPSRIYKLILPENR